MSTALTPGPITPIFGSEQMFEPRGGVAPLADRILGRDGERIEAGDEPYISELCPSPELSDHISFAAAERFYKHNPGPDNGNGTTRERFQTALISSLNGENPDGYKTSTFILAGLWAKGMATKQYDSEIILFFRYPHGNEKQLNLDFDPENALMQLRESGVKAYKEKEREIEFSEWFSKFLEVYNEKQRQIKITDDFRDLAKELKESYRPIKSLACLAIFSSRRINRMLTSVVGVE